MGCNIDWGIYCSDVCTPLKESISNYAQEHRLFITNNSSYAVLKCFTALNVQRGQMLSSSSGY